MTDDQLTRLGTRLRDDLREAAGPPPPVGRLRRRRTNRRAIRGLAAVALLAGAVVLTPQLLPGTGVTIDPIAPPDDTREASTEEAAEQIAADADGTAIVERVLTDLGYEPRDEGGVGVVFRPRSERDVDASSRAPGLPFFLVADTRPTADGDALLSHLETLSDRVERDGWPGGLGVAINDRRPSYLQFILVAPDGRSLNLTAELPDTIQQLPEAVRRIAAEWARH